MAKSEEFKRWVTSAILLPTTFYIVLFSPERVYILGVLLITALSFFEYVKMFALGNLSYLLGLTTLFSLFLFGPELSLSLILFIPFLYPKDFSKEKRILELEKLLLGVIYISLILYFINLLEIKEGRAFAASLIIVVSLNDIFAYYGGRYFGKRPFFSELSPKKTKEGSTFGFLGGILGIVISKMIFRLPISWTFSILLSIILVTSSQIGDLFESFLKRVSGKKDSGNLLPGHGGILDRIDGLIFSTPFLYHFLKLFLR